MRFTNGGGRAKSVTAMALAAIMSLGMLPTYTYAVGETYTVNVSSVNVRAEATTDSDVLTRASRGENVEVTGSDGDWYKVKYDGHTGYIRKDMLVEGERATSAPSSSATAKVTGSTVNIRKSASTGSTVLERVSEGTVLEAISISDGWVKVKYAGVTGYVSADYVSVSGLSASQGSSAKLEEMDRTGTINASEVNVREGAGTSSAKLYSLGKGDKVDVTGLKGDWYRVHTSSGTGYVLSKYVTLNSSSSSSASDDTSESLKELSGSGVITGSGVNVRKSASTSSSALYKLSKGDKVSVTGKQGDWYRIKTGQGTGFVLSDYIDYTASSSSSSESFSVDAASGSATITGSGVNVRKSPSTDADRLYQLNSGDKVEITGVSGDWYRIKTSQGEGFVKEDFLDIFVASSGAIKPGQSGDEVKRVQQRLIELGYLSGSADGKFGSGTEEAVRAFQRKAGLSVDGIVGAGTLSALNAADAPRADAGATAAPTATPAPTEGGQAEYETLKQGSNGEAVKKLQQRLVELGYLSGSVDGDFGSATTDAVKDFQKQAGLSVDGIAGSGTQQALYASDAPAKKTEADEIEEELDEIKSTLSMGSSGAEVKLLQERLISLEYMSGSADGDFGAKTREAVMLFQKQAGLTVDGKAGKATISKLFSSSAENYDGKTTVDTSSGSSGSSDSSSDSSSGVIMADWWTSNIQSVFSRGTIATVTDVDTGISWKVKRRGGTNHADVEPLTASDTAKMKQVYGSWSWNRRAIWVSVGGNTYAASMNGMPHGTQSITDNNFNGHHCIHFLNSRTHTGNRLDSAHQAAVKKAYEAGN